MSRSLTPLLQGDFSFPEFERHGLKKIAFWVFSTGLERQDQNVIDELVYTTFLILRFCLQYVP